MVVGGQFQKIYSDSHLIHNNIYHLSNPVVDFVQ